MTNENRAILLKVADEIEADPNYTGKKWVAVSNPCGCAIIRTFKYLGGKVILEEIDADQFGQDLYNVAVFNGEEFYDSYSMRGIVETQLGLSSETISRLQEYTIYHGAKDTAAVLREIAETGTFILNEEDDEDDDADRD